MVCIKMNIQKGGRCRGGGVSAMVGPGSPDHDLWLLALLRGCDWRQRHLIFNGWPVGRRCFIRRLMGPDELLAAPSAPVHKGGTIELPDAPVYIVKPPPPRCRMRQLTLPELILRGWGKTKVIRGGGGNARVAREGGGKTKVVRGGGGKTKVAREGGGKTKVVRGGGGGKTQVVLGCEV
jgi:hypothetical protein